MNTPPVTPVTPPVFSTPIKAPPAKVSVKKITSHKELLDCLFSDENIEKKDQIDRYSNFTYMRHPLNANKKAMFKGRDKSIGRAYPFYRYSIATLDALFTDYETIELKSLLPVQKQADKLSINLAHHVSTTEAMIKPSTPLACSPLSFFNQDNLKTSSSDLSPLLPLFATGDEKGVRDINPLELKTTPNSRLPLFHIPASDDDEEDCILKIDPLLTVDCRFVVISDGQGEQNMYFSLHDGADGMSHAQTALGQESEGVCISAGVITFIKQDSRWFIQSLTNKSGHFETNVEGLLNPLGIILNHMSTYLTETITIAPHTSTTSNAVSFCLNVSELHAKYVQSIPLLKQDLYSSGEIIKAVPSTLNVSSDDEIESFSLNTAATNSCVRTLFPLEERPDMTFFKKKGKNNQGEIIKFDDKAETPNTTVTP